MHILIVVALTVVSAWASVHFNLMERLHGMTKGSPGLNLDDLLLSLPVFALSIAWFAWRRRSLAMRYLEAASRAESERQTTERRFQAMVEGSADAVTLIDETGTIRYVSPSAQRVLGFGPEEAEGRPIIEFVHPEDTQAALELLQEVARHPGAARHAQFRARHKDGTWRWIEAAGRNMVRDPDVKAIVINYRDFTERKRLEEELSSSREGFENIVERNAEGVMVVDSEGIIRFANPAAGTFLSSSRDVLVGSPIGFPLTTGMLRQVDISRGSEGVGVAEMRAMETEWNGKYAFLLTLRDMTEHLRSEEALRQSELRYRDILENMEEGYYEVDLEGNLTYMNRAFCETLGRSEKELLGMNYRQLVRSEKAEGTYRVFNEVFKSGKPTKAMDWEMIRKDGALIDIEATVSPVRVSEKRYSGFRGVVRDVTARREWERILRESEERYRDLVENSVDLILIHDLSGRILSINPAAAASFGVGHPDEAIGLTVQEFLAPEVRGLFGDYLEAVVRDGRAAGFFRLRTPSGQERILAYDNTLRTDSARDPLVRGRAYDVTEKFAMEKALKASERRYRSLFERNLAGVYRTNAKGVMLECNRAMASLLGYATPDDLKEVSARNLYADPAEREPYLDDLRLEKSVSNLERTLVKKDGTTIKVLLSSTLIPGKTPDDDLIEGTIIDVTEREQLAREQMRARRLETVAALAAGVAHEVRNPLFAIQLNVNGLARRISREGEARTHMDHILAHVARLDQLIRSLMELGQAVDEEEFTTMDIAAPLRGACLMVEDERPDFKNRIFMEAPAEAPTMRIVLRKITQAFIHLIRNAAEASPEGGKVRIVCGRDADSCVIRIIDEGPGIPDKVRKNLFEPFVTTRTGQPGLGLALARHYIEAHGGTVEAENNDPPPGATFTVRLPVAAPQEGRSGP